MFSKLSYQNSKVNKLRVSKEKKALIKVYDRTSLYVIGFPIFSNRKDSAALESVLSQFGEIRKIQKSSRVKAGKESGVFIIYKEIHASCQALVALKHFKENKVFFGTNKICKDFFENKKCSDSPCPYLHKHLIEEDLVIGNAGSGEQLSRIHELYALKFLVNAYFKKTINQGYLKLSNNQNCQQLGLRILEKFEVENIILNIVQKNEEIEHSQPLHLEGHSLNFPNHKLERRRITPSSNNCAPGNFPAHKINAGNFVNYENSLFPHNSHQMQRRIDDFGDEYLYNHPIEYYEEPYSSQCIYAQNYVVGQKERLYNFGNQTTTYPNEEHSSNTCSHMGEDNLRLNIKRCSLKEHRKFMVVANPIVDIDSPIKTGVSHRIVRVLEVTYS